MKNMELLLITLVAWSSGPCQGSRGIDATQSSVGYISSAWTAQSGDGSEQCPWIITAGGGQRINIKLLDFTPRVDDQVGPSEQKILFRHSAYLVFMFYKNITVEMLF